MMNNNSNNVKGKSFTTTYSNEQPVYRSLSTLSSLENGRIMMLQPPVLKTVHSVPLKKSKVVVVADDRANFKPRPLEASYPLSVNSCVEVEPENVNSVVDCLCEQFSKNVGECKVKSEKGVIRVTGKALEMKVCFFARSDGKVVVEVNRISGCSCIFRKEYLSALCKASCVSKSIRCCDPTSQLSCIEKRLALFPVSAV